MRVSEKYKGAWDTRPQSSINVLIEESLRSPHSPEGECVEYVTNLTILSVEYSSRKQFSPKEFGELWRV
jgi:hypothetical protein